MIKDYESKMIEMLKRQDYKCTGCGISLNYYWIYLGVFYSKISIYEPIKLDFAHNLPRTKKNIKKYPLMIDSIHNASVQCNPCNVAHKRFNGEKFMTEHQAQEIENKLKEGLL